MGKKRQPKPEEREQRAFTEWARHQWWGRHYTHVPNERADPLERQVLAGLGVRPGNPDIYVDVARGGYYGLRIELKAPGGRLTPEQVVVGKGLLNQGYLWVEARGWLRAAAVCRWYFLAQALTYKVIVEGGPRGELPDWNTLKAWEPT